MSEQLTPYIRPGDCGAKVDVRWLEVSRASSKSQAPLPPPPPGLTSDGVTDAADDYVPPPAPFKREPAVLFAVAPAGAYQMREGEQAKEGEKNGDENQAAALFAFSALPNLAEDLAKAMHPEQLVPRSVTAINLDHRIMGAGGDDSWSACVHDEFLVRPGRYKFAFAMAPYWRNGGGSGGEGGVREGEEEIKNGEIYGEPGDCWRALSRGGAVREE